MKKKTIYLILAIVLIFTSATVYFIPMKLSDSMGDSSQITITVTEIGIKDGMPFIEPVSDPDITEEQIERIFTLCSQYSYRRTIHTLFSDGSISGIGGKVIYIYGNNATITVSSTGQIAVNDKIYKMKHAAQFIDQMTEIL